MDRIKITFSQMNVLLMGVEYGFKAHERGNNLERTMAGVYEIYEVAKPEAGDGR